MFQLDANYVIGREPSLDSSVADGSARPLRLTDSEGLVSRIHAKVELDGWQVYISDLESANGTYIQLPGETDGKLLPPRVRDPAGRAAPASGWDATTASRTTRTGTGSHAVDPGDHEPEP